jgi:hypothetical protein
MNYHDNEYIYIGQFASFALTQMKGTENCKQQRNEIHSRICIHILCNVTCLLTSYYLKIKNVPYY